jgi:hypothetical protein
MGGIDVRQIQLDVVCRLVESVNGNSGLGAGITVGTTGAAVVIVVIAITVVWCLRRKHTDPGVYEREGTLSQPAWAPAHDLPVAIVPVVLDPTVFAAPMILVNVDDAPGMASPVPSESPSELLSSTPPVQERQVIPAGG